MKLLSALLIGLLFGIGLNVSGMTDPARIKGFFDVFGAWDPSLIFVMAGALGVSMVGITLVIRRGKALLADKLGVAHAKMPMDIVGKYGNSSGVTIPTVLADSFGERLCRESMRLCLAGFGVGLTWAALLMKVGHLRFCSRIDYPDGGRP